MKNLYIIKIGGNVIDNSSILESFLKEISSLHSPFVLIHGGGVLASNLSVKLGLEPKMVNGRRITNEETLKITTMVYAGLINKTIAAKLCSLNKTAIGISGADGFLIPCEKREVKEIDYGYVGDVLQNKINIQLLCSLLKNNIVPVIAPITANENGQLLNTNADTIASSLAIVLSEFYKTHLIFCFEKDGVIYKNKVQNHFSKETFNKSISEGEVTGGMIPKIANAIYASDSGVYSVQIGNANNFQKILKYESGTRIN